MSRLGLRPLEDADVPRVVALVNEATPELPVDDVEMRTWLSHPAREIAFALVEDARGELVAYADLTPAGGDAPKGWLDPRIPRDLVSEETIDAVLGWAEEQARARGWVLLRTSVSSRSPLAPLLEARGYRPIRVSFRMRIDLDGPPPEPVWPDGIEVRTFQPGDERAVYAADAEAFRDHWDFTGFPYEEFEHFLLRADDFDPSLWLIARDGEEVAGVSLCRPSAPGRPDVGWVRSLAVRRPWRRRGLGLALLLASFGAFWERGTRTIGLGVDGENTTGAVRLYEKAGMRVEHRFDTYERSLA